MGLITPAIASSWQERVWRDHGSILFGVVLGAGIGLLIDLAASHGNGEEEDEE